MTEASDNLNELLSQPKSISVDGQTVTQHSPQDLIAADKHVGANSVLDAVASGVWPFARVIINRPSARGD